MFLYPTNDVAFREYSVMKIKKYSDKFLNSIFELFEDMLIMIPQVKTKNQIVF